MIPIEIPPSDNTHTNAQEDIENGITTLSATVTNLPPHNDAGTALTAINDLKFFLATAPVNWQENQMIRRYFLNNELGFVSCICWNKLFYITGTDIVKVCQYMMQNFGRAILHKKKFEEGIFSDLRNLKCGVDAILEQPKSEFLSFLFKNMCLKTQKKQKVFFWFSVPHEKLFSDALERDLKRETLNQQCCTRAVGQPAISFHFNFSSSQPLFKQLQKFFEDIEELLASGKTLPNPPENQIQIRNNIPMQHPMDDQYTNNELHSHVIQSDGIPQQNINDHHSRIPTPIRESNKNIDDNEIEERVLPSNNNITHSMITNPNNKHSSDIIYDNDTKNSQAVYETSTNPDIKSQKIVVENKDLLQNEGEALPDTYSNNKGNNFIQDVSSHKDEDFPLDYFPVSIEYPNQQPIQQQAPQNEYNSPLPNLMSPIANMTAAPILSHAGFESFGSNMNSNVGPILQVSSGATISEEDSIPNNLNGRYQLQVAPNSNIQTVRTPVVMTNRDFYESNKKKLPTSPRPSYQTHQHHTSFTSFGNPQRIVSGDLSSYEQQQNDSGDRSAYGEPLLKAVDEVDSSQDENHLSSDENEDDQDEIQYEVQHPNPQYASVPQRASMSHTTQPMPPPQGVYGNQMYSGFFYPLPYNSASQEFVNYEQQQNYFPEDYLPYKDQQDGHPQYGSIHDFQAQQYGQPAYPYQTPQISTTNTSWNVLPPEALQPATNPSNVLPKSAQRYQFTPNRSTSGSNINITNQPNRGQNASPPLGSRVSSTVITKLPGNNGPSVQAFTSSSTSSSRQNLGNNTNNNTNKAHGHSRSLSSNKISKPLHTKASKFQSKLNNTLAPKLNIESVDDYDNEDISN
ncbi:similar to Saccharomyces cerevisiae YHR084W STE12 Transcription factor that is activated by a MAP kinase signaling cascade [Maudiozyma barnettii]|uniref:Similar to Saccharomyces cerevisiae YHR084W STE12 Transcription factor that is activated by a MAP kinase signaling cascade n=1 Tax=Maudiozyma barnettii TaxID=61262 RepID=A0A8H2VAU5_9SACH|nr:homeodomain family transcription factor STE12 [Kazachstania barnettii]CAB4251864.1 similar to Saccharomyces cerevisiae YHR084W STE12 Transcription factor that is activated by a MAP kinase signaling cascade [Kazachstania barnettii]CAD1778149.1 similar to Saccharomyces cerevisiae YHR084W STE12 Transcription factor that is activated by a MAP kinase signaling cascade [Kazachstania barnettii]